MTSIRCAKHPDYQVKAKPTADCSTCNRMWQRKHAARTCANPTCRKVFVWLGNSRQTFCSLECHYETKRAPQIEGIKATPKKKDLLVEKRTETAMSLDIVKKTDHRVKGLEDLLRVCEVDGDIWEVSTWTLGKWEMGAMERIKDGNTAVTGNAVVTELFRVEAKFKRRAQDILDHQRLNTLLVEDMRRLPTVPKPRWTKQPGGGYLLEYSPFDLHAGKLTWEGETPTNYDINSAVDLFKGSLHYLFERAMRLSGGKLERILCVFGNDVSHSDSKRGMTTGGTPLDNDSRYLKVFRRITEIHIYALEFLRQVAPVDVVIVPGNHDELTAFMLGEVLEARYHDTPGITFNNSAKLRKYYEFGTNMWGFTHGNVEAVRELGLTMAREEPEMWARCASREWHLGHKHISEKFEAKTLPGRVEQDLISDKGVRIRRITSLSGHDFWHTQHAYMDRRCGEAFLFHKTAGFCEHMSFNVDHFTGLPVSSTEQGDI